MKPELEYTLDNLGDVRKIFDHEEGADPTLLHTVLALTMAVEHVGRVLSDFTSAYRCVNRVRNPEGTDYPVYTYSLPEKPGGSGK